MRWVEITVSATAASADAVTDILMREGCGGTAVSRSSGSASEDDLDVRGYLPVDDRLEDRLLSIRSRVIELPGLGLPLQSEEVSIKWVDDEDWATAWKKYFKPTRIGKRIVIKPSWEDYAALPSDVIVEIDPGMAFGTGSHATTQLCLKALEEFVRGGETVLDMGTGSAILAMAAARLGATRVVGLDIDPVAVEVARKNVNLQHLEDVITINEADSPKAFDDQADIIVANIIASVIISLAEDLRAKLKPGGKLITSGIIRERRDEVRDKLESIGLKTLDSREDGEWVAIVSELA